MSLTVVMLKIKKELFNNFFIKIDWAYRLYTVINIPNELIEDPYRVRSKDLDKDIDILSDQYIRKYAYDLSVFLNENGLQELYGWYSREKVGKFSYLLVIGYQLFKTQKILRGVLIGTGFILLLSYIFYYLSINNMI